MSLVSSSELQDDISIFEQSSPEPLRARVPTLSPHAHDHYSSTSDGRTPNGDTDDDYFSRYKPIKQCSSSRSSISSFPASVVHHTPLTDTDDDGRRGPTRTQSYDRTSKTPSHGYLSAFRNPSSVRALQLESEWADSDTLSIRNTSQARRSPRTSHFSPRSPGSVHSSPTKRSSRSGTPSQQRQSSSKLKKEFPLVLLHCRLLPPAVAIRGPLVSDEILEAVLPEEYRKRWRTLQDKVASNTEVKQRGVLIPHPRDDYDILEERLLEALELERPRIRRGHYLGGKGGDSDSGFESSSQNDTDEGSDPGETKEDEPGDKCLDCGKAVSCNVEQERRWEVKVFAANGLMRSGAWSAAWEEMEKVDVEVGVWMPEEVRAEVEERLKALQAKADAEKPVEEPAETRKKSRRTRSDTAKVRYNERMKEIYGDTDTPKTQAEIDGLVDEKKEPEVTPRSNDQIPQRPTSTTEPSIPPPETTRMPVHNQPPVLPIQENFSSFMARHISLIWNDQKNLAIVLLSIMVLLFSIQNAQANNTAASALPSVTESSVSPSLDSATSTHIANLPPISYVTTTIFAPSAAGESPTTGSATETPVPVPAELKQEFCDHSSALASTPEPELDTVVTPPTEEVPDTRIEWDGKCTGTDFDYCPGAYCHNEDSPTEASRPIEDVEAPRTHVVQEEIDLLSTLHEMAANDYDPNAMDEVDLLSSAQAAAGVAEDEPIDSHVLESIDQEQTINPEPVNTEIESLEPEEQPTNYEQRDDGTAADDVDSAGNL